MQVPLGKVLPDKKTLIQRSWGQTMVEKTKCQVYGQQTNLEHSFKISNSRENFYYLNNFMMNKTTSCTNTIINMQQLLNMDNIFLKCGLFDVPKKDQWWQMKLILTKRPLLKNFLFSEVERVVAWAQGPRPQLTLRFINFYLERK